MTLMIYNPGKIGIGTWDFDNRGTALTHVEALDFGWYYNWRGEALWDAAGGAESLSSEFVPMIWGRAEVDPLLLEQITKSSADTLLGFNEPDHKPQANMSVEEALALWPELMATGKRLGSPAPTTHGAIGEDSWLGQFMQGAQDKGYQVDFIAAHYYADDKDVGAFKSYLESLHDAYGLPIWVTEWALVDWLNPDRFAPEEIAAFASEAIQMMDGLDFVERHAWFGAYEGGDGWHINTELFDSKGQLTPVGNVFAQALSGDALAAGDDNEDLAGAIEGDELAAGDDDEDLAGAIEDDELAAGDVDEDLTGAIEDDELAAGDVDEDLAGVDGDALADAGEGNNVPKGGAGNNRGKKKVAGEGDDVQKTGGGPGKKKVAGEDNDVLSAGGGDNVLSDGPGRDMLISRPSDDTFVYTDVAHIGKGAGRDVIRDVKLGTDLQAFSFIGAAARAQAGQLRSEDGILSGDVNGNGQADFELRFANSALWSSDDFLV